MKFVKFRVTSVFDKSIISMRIGAPRVVGEWIGCQIRSSGYCYNSSWTYRSILLGL